MTISFWRYSHLALAVSSFLFIVLAAVTGIILAVEPISQKTQPYRSQQFDKLSLAEALPVLTTQYHDITELKIDANGFVALKGSDAEENTVAAYVDPANGKQLGKITRQNEFFQWVTALHRSLFLHELGRFFIGLTAFLLFLIAVSGTVLIIQRQRGWKNFFNSITRDSFSQFYHVYLGRLTLIPIIIIALTGTILSLQKFGIIPDTKISHKIDPDAIKTMPKKKLADFTVFKNIKLSEVKEIEFPFSSDPEDYYTLKLKDRELTVNQVTGDILTQSAYPMTVLITNLSLDLHTGRGSITWSLLLGIAAINILFFVYSGFAMTLQRRSGIVKNKYKAHQSKFIILVGSENGTTFRFAKAVHEQIMASGNSSFITELNNYQLFPNAEHLIVITATYGSGEAPANASRFIKLVETNPQQQPVHFSVVGLGSHAYPDFCQFAFEVNNILAHQPWARPLLEIHTVNDKSPAEFGLWAEFWSQKTGIHLKLSPEELVAKPVRLQKMTVTAKQSLVPGEPYFSISLQARKRLKYTSGDLLAIYPANDHRERLYSIGKVDKQIQLSVKLHEGGIGSELLHALPLGGELHARVIANDHFHFPEKASGIIMISNGTGIAPFLGMIDQNDRKITCSLYCGFRGASSFGLYHDQLQDALQKEKLSQLHVAYSRENNKQYVSDLVGRDADTIAATLANNGVILLCGSLSMQNSVIEQLEIICAAKNKKTVSYYQSHGQILMDCY